MHPSWTHLGVGPPAVRSARSASGAGPAPNGLDARIPIRARGSRIVLSEGEGEDYHVRPRSGGRRPGLGTSTGWCPGWPSGVTTPWRSSCPPATRRPGSRTTCARRCDAVPPGAARASGGAGLAVVGQSLGGLVAPVVAQQCSADLLVLVAPMIPRPGETGGEWWQVTDQAGAFRRFAADQGRDPAAMDDDTVHFHDVPASVRAEAMRRPVEQTDGPFRDPWPLDRWPDVPTRVVGGQRRQALPARLRRPAGTAASRRRSRPHRHRPPAGPRRPRRPGRPARPLRPARSSARPDPCVRVCFPLGVRHCQTRPWSCRSTGPRSTASARTSAPHGGTLTVWGWSSETEADAARVAASGSPRRSSASRAREGSPAGRGYYPRVPLREPVLEEVEAGSGALLGVVTPTGWGARCCAPTCSSSPTSTCPSSRTSRAGVARRHDGPASGTGAGTGRRGARGAPRWASAASSAGSSPGTPPPRR